MKLLTYPVLIGVCVVLSNGCSLSRPSPTPSTPAIGDACLVGSWSLDLEVSRSGWSYSNIPVSVSGLRGAKLTLGADGTEMETFTGSAPLVGATADGRVLSISVGGSYTFHVHADGHQYVEVGTATAVPVTATISGVPIPGYHGEWTPGTETYSCSQESLTTTSSAGVQTDSWSRA